MLTRSIVSDEPDKFRFHWQAATRLFLFLSLCGTILAACLMWQAAPAAAPLRGTLLG